MKDCRETARGGATGVCLGRHIYIYGSPMECLGYNTQTLHVCHIYLHWGGAKGVNVGIYAIHGVSGIGPSVRDRSP